MASIKLFPNIGASIFNNHCIRCVLESLHEDKKEEDSNLYPDLELRMLDNRMVKFSRKDAFMVVDILEVY